MRCELPILLRCCFCFPLRFGLLVWAYIKQILSLVMLTTIIWKLCMNNSRMGGFSYAILIIGLVSTIFDIVFHVLFIISAHTKDYRKMRIFYRYSIGLLSLYVGIYVLFIGNIIYHIYMVPFLVIFFWYMAPLLVTYLLIILSQGYLILLVRSEFMKLKNNSQFEFVNNAPEEKCTANFDLNCPNLV